MGPDFKGADRVTGRTALSSKELPLIVELTKD